MEFSLFHYILFIPSSLSLVEERAKHVHCVPSELVLANLGRTAIGPGLVNSGLIFTGKGPIKLVLRLCSGPLKK